MQTEGTKILSIFLKSHTQFFSVGVKRQNKNVYLYQLNAWSPEGAEEMGVGTSEALGLILAPPGTQTFHTGLWQTQFTHTLLKTTERINEFAPS